MAKRKSKKPQQEDTSILLDSSVPQSKRRINSSAFSPALLFIIIFTVGASIMGWFCVQQQYSIDEMSESFTTMQKRISNLQQVMLTTDPQSDAGFGVEERIFALEEAQKQAEEKAKVALATSEKLKNSEVYSQLLALHDEMDIRLAEMKQVSVSVTTLQAMFKNQSEQFEAMKRSVAAGLSSSLALAQNVAGLTDAVTSASSRADKQTALVESLNAQLEGQASELDELKESMELHSAALDTNNQEISAINVFSTVDGDQHTVWRISGSTGLAKQCTAVDRTTEHTERRELVETKQTLRAQALEEMLNSVQMTLDEQFFTSQTLHSSVMAQLQTFYTQLANAPAWSKKLKSNEEEIISTTAQKTSEVQEKLEDDEEEAEQEDAEDDAEQEAKEEEVMHPLEQEEEEEEDFTEEQDEEDITEEEEEITEEEEDETTEEEEEILEDEEETTEEKEILEDEEETTEEEEEILEDEEDEDITEESEEEAEEEDTEETDDVLDESLEEEEVFEEEEESWETEEEESADDFMDENEGDE